MVCFPAVIKKLPQILQNKQLEIPIICYICKICESLYLQKLFLQITFKKFLLRIESNLIEVKLL